jgi:transposase
MLGKAVQRWRIGASDLSDKTRSGRPVTASGQLHQDRVEELIRGNFVEK